MWGLVSNKESSSCMSLIGISIAYTFKQVISVERKKVTSLLLNTVRNVIFVRTSWFITTNKLKQKKWNKE